MKIRYKKITQKLWNETPKSYKSIIHGRKYRMFMTNKGTALVPVKVVKK